MRLIPAVLSFAVIGCGSPQPRQDSVPASGTLSVNEHTQEVKRHEREAAHHRRRYNPGAHHPEAPRYQCADEPVAGTVESGGESMPVFRPCWRSVTNPTAWHLAEVRAHKNYAAQHRDRIADLLRTERQACKGLGEAAISHSPMFHREDITAVTAYRERGKLKGARVVFRKLPGLTARWLHGALFCHQARAAVMGYSKTFHAYCPASLPGVSVATREVRAGIVVTLRATDEVTAVAVLGRAKRLLAAPARREASP